ncbi:NAD kinase [Novimethylophilus kurashikiensis]|uniref:NAD kinase n=1 Tax=Novimethylophilus kurashikiensis TaxID=1825523 RepID=A0A2R5FCR9_9PROT|nr:DUF3095 domain-containing protein [Novimethylophilus kurashikiensis]GBG15990.1 NAD kinase [Novimethylophilus kurashikiensis]
MHFYRNIQALDSFAAATDSALHAELPADWWVVIADVEGSTAAIQAGQYKKVNTVGVACIAAVANVDRDIDLPFVFGGDGATFAIPEALRDRVIIALRGAQKLAREQFGLVLRAGLMRAGELQAEDFWMRLGKLRLSPHVTLPVLSGRGWEEAERRVKDSANRSVLRVNESEGPAEANFEGFECRWQNVPSFNDHKLSLLVAATSQDTATNLATYQRVVALIQSIYGDVAKYHPLRAERLQLSFNPTQLSHEWRVRSNSLGWLARCGYFVRLWLLNCAGHYLFSRNIDTQSVQWSRYRNELVDNSDFRKFDGMLRMVMDGSEEQARRLQARLDEEYVAGRLVYGMHKSREALVTCLVRSYTGSHMHFVDGSDGGYALAATDLKAKLHRLKTVTTAEP